MDGQKISAIFGSSKSKIDKSKIGFVLDIDGVFLKGKEVIEGTPEALQILLRNKIPFVFVTNGGGVSESQKASDISRLLDIECSSDMVLLSHSPFQNLASAYKDKRVMVVGSRGCDDVARAYGFNKVVTSKQLLLEAPSSFKQIRTADMQNSHPHNPHFSAQSDHPKEPVVAAFVIGDPHEWALDLQMLTDQLRKVKEVEGIERIEDSGGDVKEQDTANAVSIDIDTRTGEEATLSSPLPSPAWEYDAAHIGCGDTRFTGPAQRIPLFASNADLVYTNEHTHARYTQGAFTHALKGLYEAVEGPLTVHYCGKPFSIQYRTAETMLQRRRAVLHPQPSSSFSPSTSTGDKDDGESYSETEIKTGIDIEIEEYSQITHFIGVGDNPLADIRGANDAGANWRSVLVRTGVWVSSADNCESHPASLVAGNVLDAVKALGLE